MRIDALQAGIEEGRFAGGGAATDQDRNPLGDGGMDEIVNPICAQMPYQLAIDVAEAADGYRDLIERTVVAILLEREVIDDLLADRDRAAFGAAGGKTIWIRSPVGSAALRIGFERLMNWFVAAATRSPMFWISSPVRAPIR